MHECLLSVGILGSALTGRKKVCSVGVVDLVLSADHEAPISHLDGYILQGLDTVNRFVTALQKGITGDSGVPGEMS